MATSVKQADFVKTALRLPPDVHARLHEEAQANGRSYNAEIVARLAASLEKDTQGVQAPLDFDEMAAAIAQRLSHYVTADKLLIDKDGFTATAQERFKAYRRSVALKGEGAGADPSLYVPRDQPADDPRQVGHEPPPPQTPKPPKSRKPAT